MNFSAIGLAWRRAFVSQWHPKILLLSLLPTVLAVMLWILVIWLGYGSLSEFIQAQLLPYMQSSSASSWLTTALVFLIKHALVPLLAAWLLLPMMVLTALIFIGLLAMPTVVKHVSVDYPQLERKFGGTLLGSFWVNCRSALQFFVMWLLSLPLCLIPGVTLLLHPLLLGWLTYRVMAYDALADHASAEELQQIKQAHRPSLIAIGTLGGLFTSLPSVIVLNGGVLAFPVLAIVAIWVYVLVFIFIGLWFEYYCLDALEKLRSQKMPLQQENNLM